MQGCRKAGANPGVPPIVLPRPSAQAPSRTRWKDARYDRPALPPRSLLLSAQQDRDRSLARRSRRARARGPCGRRPHQRRPDAARNGLHEGHGRPRVEVARSGVRQQSARTAVHERKAHEQAEHEGRQRDGQGGQGHAARRRGDQPALGQGLRVPVEEQEDRLHPGQARRQPERPHQGRGPGRARRGRTRREGGHRRGDRRLCGPAALQAQHAHQRSDRARRRGDHPAVRVRNGDGDGPADRHRGPRAGERPGADQDPGALQRRADGRADARHDDRPRRGDRLRPLHRHPSQAAAARRHGDA